jgi:hypothetical protein
MTMKTLKAVAKWVVIVGFVGLMGYLGNGYSAVKMVMDDE